MDAQTAKKLNCTNQQCNATTKPILTKRTTCTTPSAKTLASASTKKRRLKNYQSNHKIARKRKNLN